MTRHSRADAPKPNAPPARGFEPAFAVMLGLFLGLALLKFGNPVILDDRVFRPVSFSDWWSGAWPPHWSFWFLPFLALAAAGLALRRKAARPASRWLWLLPLAWFGWQILSAAASVDHKLSALALWQFGGCIGFYFAGALVIGRQWFRWLLPGLVLAFTVCLVRAVDQKLFEFPVERQALIQGQSNGWTNFPPRMVQEFKRDGFIISTNGAEILNPEMMAKYKKGRVFGTLIYPNALAGAVLLLWPVTIAAAFESTRDFRRLSRLMTLALVLFLGAAGLFWSGSKAGWLIALALALGCLCRTRLSRRLKWGLVGASLAAGLLVFAVRFHRYFAKGATSVAARLDYWHAAAIIWSRHPLLGTGPGTFEHPYAAIKPPGAEMARLTHNDYLEQFSDSGLVGGLSYAAWILVLLWTIGRRVWKSGPWLEFSIFLGLLGWFGQGLVEFSLYVPALAWTAFAFRGCLVGCQNESTEPRTPARLVAR